MIKKVIDVKGVAKPPSPFNHVVRAGNLLFLSSQLSVDLKNNIIIDGTIEEQTRRALENIKLLLEGVGSTMNDVVKTTVYLKNIEDFDEMNAVYKEYFSKGDEPARVTIQAISPIDKIKIEIDAIVINNS